MIEKNLRFLVRLKDPQAFMRMTIFQSPEIQKRLAQTSNTSFSRELPYQRQRSRYTGCKKHREEAYTTVLCPNRFLGPFRITVLDFQDRFRFQN